MKGQSGPTRHLKDGEDTATELQNVIARFWLRAVILCAGIVAVANWIGCNFWVGGYRCEILAYKAASDDAKAVDKSTSDAFLTEPWSMIKPSKELVYSPCFDGFNCTRLEVPVDWNSTDPDGHRVNLAIVKLPAKVPVTDPRYGGLLWLQTGGPGSSGVNFVLTHGKTVQMIVDSELDPSIAQYDSSNPPKYYDILGMDPRGINSTTPRISCFPDMLSRDVWTLQSRAEGIIGTSDTSLETLWARASALGEGCSNMAGSSKSPEAEIAFHMNTTPFVRDIVEVIEQHGKWRQEEAQRTLARLEDHSAHMQGQKAADVTTRTKWRKGEEQLLYWGLSYGTVVGATFAAMQPHRVARAVIDGVVDTPDYYRGEWLHNLQDTDAVLDSFFEYCYKAGPELCALYTAGGQREIKQRFENILASLEGKPIGVAGHGSIAPDLITRSDLLWTIRTAVYAPLQYWPTLVALLVDIERRNGTSFAMSKQQELQISVPPDQCREARPYTPYCAIPPNQQLGETQTAILCSDRNTTYDLDRSAFEAYVAKLKDQCWLLGPSMAQARLGCVQWNLKPKWRFPGPFVGETAHPMMVVGTARDPVTPIRNAYALADRFPGAAVSAIDGEGHTVLTAPSLCMARHIRDYFQTGALPANGTICEASEKAFLGITDPGEIDEQELLEQWRWSARHFFA